MSHQPEGRACYCGQRGWMPGVEHIPPQWAIPPMSQRAMTPLAVMDHIMVGWLTTMVTWMRTGESKIIAHFGISRTGRIVQFHPADRVGRHVSAIDRPASRIVQREGQHANTTGANGYTVGIEHEGFSMPLSANDSVTVRSATWTRSNPWPEAMVQASARVKRWLFATYPSLGQPSRDTIIGHFEADLRNRPDDPAHHLDRSVWPRERMIALSSTGGGVTPPKEVLVETNYGVIKPGEWLSMFAQRVGVSVAELSRINGIADPDKIPAWQPLRLREKDAQGRDVPRPPLLNFGVAPSPDAVREEMVRQRGWLMQTGERLARAQVAQDEAVAGIAGAIADIDRRLAGGP